MVFSALSYDFYVKTIWFMRLFHMVLLWCGVYSKNGATVYQSVAPGRDYPNSEG